MITALTNTSQINTYKSHTPRLRVTNILQKPDCVSFSSKNLLNLSSDRISKIIIESIKRTNYIGEGKEGEVYRIPDTDYCIKIIKKNRFNRTPFGKWTTEINEADKTNHILAKAENGTLIMQYIEGIPLFKYKDMYKLAELPEEIYKQLLKQVYRAKNHGLAFDNAPSNVIYNSEKQTLTAIDFYKPEFEFEIFPFTRVSTVLDCSIFTKHDSNANKKITGKLLNIALEEYSKKDSPELKINDDDIIRCVNRFEFLYREILPPQYKFLKQAFIDITELKKAQRRGENVDTQIAGKIKYAKAIIRQILIDIQL